MSRRPPHPRLTHLTARGEMRMVDVAGKAVTKRVAVATADFTSTPAVIRALLGGTGKKGDALAAARLAGIMAAKKTPELIPLCHPLPLTKVEVGIERRSATVLRITATVETEAKTGVEMEALTAASLAALTLYDMAKALSKACVISEVRLESKSGGKSGAYVRKQGRG